MLPTTPGAKGESCTDRSHPQTMACATDTNPNGQGLVSTSSSPHGLHQVISAVYMTCVPSHISCLSLTLILTGKDALVPNELGHFISENECPTFIFKSGFSQCPISKHHLPRHN